MTRPLPPCRNDNPARAEIRARLGNCPTTLTDTFSKNGADLYRIAILAGFNPVDLMRAICKIARGNKIKASTVEKAIAAIAKQYKQD